MHKLLMRRLLSLLLVLAFVTVDAFAAVKEIMLWGAKSINDMGNSDRQITMDELQEDYSGYLQTDGMTEFFHKDQGEIPKTDMTEALAWLIDNGIINRDETITVSNINGVPSVSIVKSDLNSKLFLNVNRSDALMYIYKAVFGPLNGRTVGVETPNVRSDNGKQVLFSDMLSKYTGTVLQQSGSSSASNGSSGSNGLNSGGTGGSGGTGSSSSNYSISRNWYYTPQGDEYTSVFGDTNIFISENNFTQESTGGDGGNGGTGVSGGALNSGTGGDGGNGGSASNVINYETDYKQIYFVPGSDILFYRTDDVVEMYLQSILSKGILENDAALRTTKFEDTFLPLTESNSAIAGWSGDADPYVTNLSKGKHIRVENVAYVSTSNVLGVNYSVRSTGTSLTISRHNLFDSDTGYFSTEETSRMDLYRYIYYMVYANEKKMSDLERDLVNYKYGMEFDGISNQEDTEILKYLVAKGILDYDGSTELSNLYGSVSWYDFIPILYRVANSNARLNFSAIQLTDSEQSWKSKGFAPQTVHMVDAGAIGELSIELDPSYVVEQSGTQGPTVEELEGGNTVASIFSPLSIRGLSAIGSALFSFLGITVVKAEPATIGEVTYKVENSGAMTFNGYFFDFQGATYGNNEKLLSAFDMYLNQMDSATREQYLDQINEGFDQTNPKHAIVGYILKNIYAISMLQRDSGLRSQMMTRLNEWSATQPSNMSSSTYQAKKMVAGYLKNMLEAASTGVGAPTNIVFTMTDGTTTNTPSAGGDVEGFATRLKSIKFDMPSTVSSARTTYTYEFMESSAGSLLASGSDVVDAVNNSAVEFSKRVTDTELQDAGSEEAVKQQVAQKIGTSLINGTSTSTTAFEQFVDPTGQDAFVSWASIEKAIASNELQIKIPLVKVSDYLLYNTDTDTYAYFSDATDGGKAVALVGTAVVTGDPDLGVMFKSGEGEAAVVYYHVNAIRLLLNAAQESAVISGVRSISMPNGNFGTYTGSIDLVSESGVSEGKITGLQCLISRNYTSDMANFSEDSAFRHSTVVNNQAWGRYLTLSQANRVMNIITRRVKYTSISGKENVTAYAVVRFVPVDAEALGTVKLSSSSSLQDLLDAPAQAPSDPAAKQVWTKNKSECNAYANWIYGTSNQTYIETGYVRPEATLYVLGDESDSLPPESIFSPLSTAQQAAVSVVPMGKVYTGAVASISETPTATLADVEARRCAYWLSANCEAVISGDRIYLHEYLFENLTVSRDSSGPMYARVNNIAASQAAFSLGATFKVDGVSDTLANGMTQPNITVIETKDDGTVRCQVGPIKGVPVSFGSTKAVIYATGDGNNVSLLSSYDLSSGDGENRLVSTFNEMFAGMPEVKNLGISQSPIFSAGNSSAYYVYTGTDLKIYERQGTKPLATVKLPTATSTDTMASYIQSIKKQTAKYSTVHPNLCQTYLTIEFPASLYRVRNGKLQRGESSATEFLSPSLFSSLNDLIIDEMINQSNGAIPVNEIPNGALLKIGNCYYQAVGSSKSDKQFIGYAYLNSTVTTPTIQDAASAFGNQFIRAGNQYANVSHWFDSDTAILGSRDSKQMEALANVAEQTLRVDGSAKHSVDANGNTEVIVPSATGGAGSLYCPIKIVFIDGLYAYKVSSPNSDAATRYNLCTSAENSVAGAFSNLPFFSNRVLDSELYDQTTELITTGFEYYEGADNLMAMLSREFQAAFEGDLITLIRMILFIVLCWLVLASWVCYACRIGNILPILDAIKYPTGNRESKGVDLFKIFSLGTISLETEFGLGRFIQYNAILAALICVVMLSGRITFGT